MGALHPHQVLSILAGIAVIAVITIVEYRGAKETVLSENVIAGIKITLLLVFVVVGTFVIFLRSEPTAALTPFLPNGIGGLVVAMALTFVAFEGFEVIIRSGEEIRSPRLNIPRAIFLSRSCRRLFGFD